MKTEKNEGRERRETVVARDDGAATSAGQSGDTQGLSDVAEAGPESVEELAEEGQAFEADAISGIEDADNAGEAEVHTKQVPEDDVPLEYQEDD